MNDRVYDNNFALAAFAMVMLVLSLTSCEQREPLSQGLVMAQADVFIEDKGWQWGPIRQVWQPALESGGESAAEIRGSRWWQVDFHGPHQDGLLPIVLVDADTGWVRLPPADYQPRQSRLPETSLQAGSYVLVLEGATDDLVEERDRLNAQAESDGHVPLFVIRESRRHGKQLVYGWNGSNGLALDPSIRAWVVAQASWADVYWLGLGAETRLQIK